MAYGRSLLCISQIQGQAVDRSECISQLHLVNGRPTKTSGRPLIWKILYLAKFSSWLRKQLSEVSATVSNGRPKFTYGRPQLGRKIDRSTAHEDRSTAPEASPTLSQNHENSRKLVLWKLTDSESNGRPHMRISRPQWSISRPLLDIGRPPRLIQNDRSTGHQVRSTGGARSRNSYFSAGSNRLGQLDLWPTQSLKCPHIVGESISDEGQSRHLGHGYKNPIP